MKRNTAIILALLCFVYSCKKDKRKNIYTIKNESSKFVNLQLFIQGTPYNYEIADSASVTIDNDDDGNSYIELSDSAHIYFDNYKKLQWHTKHTGDGCPGSTLYSHPQGETIKLYCSNYYESETFIDNYTKAFLYVIDTTDYKYISIEL